MAATIVHSQFVGAGGTGLTLGTTPTSGNLLVVVGGARNSGFTTPAPTFTPPAGFSLVARAAPMEQHSVFVSWKVADGTESQLAFTADVGLNSEFIGAIEINDADVTTWQLDTHLAVGSNATNVSSIATGSTGALSNADGAAVIVGTSRSGTEALSLSSGTSLDDADQGSLNSIVGWLDLTATTALNITVSEASGASRMGAVLAVFNDAAGGPVTVTGTASGTISASGAASGTVTEAVFTGTASGTVSVSGVVAATPTEAVFAGTAAGTVAVSGTATGTPTEAVSTGIASGVVSASGAVTGTVTEAVVVGTAAGVVSASGAATGTVTEAAFTGTASGTVSVAGSASGGVPPPANYPTVETTSTYGIDLAATTHFVTLPTGIIAGDTLVLIVRNPGTTVTTPTDWTLEASGASGMMYVFSKVANGSEGSSVAITQGASLRLTANVYRLSSGDAVEASISDTSNPPSLSPAWGSGDVLWIAAYSSRRSDWTVATPPTGYTTQITAADGSSTASTRTKVVSLRREATTATEDPAAFSITGTQDSPGAATIAVQGVAGAPTTTGTASGVVSGAGSATGTATEGVTTGTATGTVAVSGTATSGSVVQNLKYGTVNVDAVYFGSTQVDAVYRGLTQVM